MPSSLHNAFRRGWRRWLLVVISTVAVVAAGCPAASAAGGGVRCRSYSQSGTVPASLVPSGVALGYTVVGQLCAADYELRNGRTVQLLLHGATYNHSYWDFGTFPYQGVPVRYSYARQLAAAGIPTFAIDQLGAGQSSKPPSNDVTVEVVGYVDHEVVQGLRDGSIVGVHFGKVIEVGHSGGSFAAWQEASTYRDVDGVIITGAVHHLTQAFLSAVFADSYSASEDPKFADQSWAIGDPGYLTERPGTRASLFYNTDHADPNVIAADDNETPFSQETFDNEPGKDVIAAGFEGSFALTSSTRTQAINVPVLIIMGSNDFPFCGVDAQGVDFDCSSGTVIAEQEAPYYGPQAHLEACSVANSGHDISLHLNFWVQEAAAISWSYHFVGQSGYHGGNRLPQPCGWTG